MTKDELVNIIRKYRYTPEPGDIVVHTTSLGEPAEPWLRICLAITNDDRPVFDSGVSLHGTEYMYAKYCGEVKAAYEAFRGGYAETEEREYMGYRLAPSLGPTEAPPPEARAYLDTPVRRVVRTERTVTYYE